MGTNDLAGDDPAGQTGWARRGQALSLTFDVESQTVLPGGTLAFPFRLHNEASASVTYQFRLEVEDPLHLDDWSVRGPTVLGAGEMAGVVGHAQRDIGYGGRCRNPPSSTVCAPRPEKLRRGCDRYGFLIG